MVVHLAGGKCIGNGLITLCAAIVNALTDIGVTGGCDATYSPTPVVATCHARSSGSRPGGHAERGPATVRSPDQPVLSQRSARQLRQARADAVAGTDQCCRRDATDVEGIVL